MKLADAPMPRTAPLLPPAPAHPTAMLLSSLFGAGTPLPAHISSCDDVVLLGGPSHTDAAEDEVPWDSAWCDAEECGEPLSFEFDGADGGFGGAASPPEEEEGVDEEFEFEDDSDAEPERGHGSRRGPRHPPMDPTAPETARRAKRRLDELLEGEDSENSPDNSPAFSLGRISPASDADPSDRTVHRPPVKRRKPLTARRSDPAKPSGKKDPKKRKKLRRALLPAPSEQPPLRKKKPKKANPSAKPKQRKKPRTPPDAPSPIPAYLVHSLAVEFNRRRQSVRAASPEPAKPGVAETGMLDGRVLRSASRASGSPQREDTTPTLTSDPPARPADPKVHLTRSRTSLIGEIKGMLKRRGGGAVQGRLRALEAVEGGEEGK
ncbi:hypothetical protein DFJ74DRAFT_210435 [Hyaloraphidium curvatum]|nr:hypothetical protein DFJ74DRAFT_210435 [Hyaloraphidium curvatum]